MSVMAINATITPNNTRRHAELSSVTGRDNYILRRALTVTVLLMIVMLPLTGLITAVNVGHPARVDALRLDYHHTTYSLPHLPHTTDNLLDGQEKYPRGLFM